MSDKYIPEHIDPFRYAEQGLSLDGKLKIAHMQRLSSYLAGTGEDANVNLQFKVDEQGTTYLTGHLETRLILQCQRCMEPYTYEIMSNFVLGIAKTQDEANDLPDHYEPVVSKEDGLALVEVIEDEIILNLPIIPRHEPEACKVILPLQDAGWEQGKGENPFHVLESLKQKQRIKRGE